jgi:anti-sigma-K factor RskA
MRARRTSLHALVGAYVLDALPDGDRAAFEHHLLTCEQCRDDVRGLREAGALLAAAVAVAPRSELRRPTLEAAALIRQLPPVVSGDRPTPRSWRFRLPSAGIVRPWLAWVSVTVAVGLAVTAVVLGVHMAAMQGRLAAQDRRDSAISAILGAHDAVALTAAVRTGGTATVVMSHQAHALVFTANGLTSLPGSRRYELWLTGPAGTSPAGMLPPRRHGMSGPMVVGRIVAGDVLELTVEPVGGSSHPTSAPIVWMVLDT